MSRPQTSIKPQQNDSQAQQQRQPSQAEPPPVAQQQLLPSSPTSVAQQHQYLYLEELSGPSFQPPTEVPWPGPGPQPLQLQRNVDSVQGWSSGLFDCFKQPLNALVTAGFPCLTFGQIAEIIHEGYPYVIRCLIGMAWIMSCTYRTRLRNKFGLPASPTPDFVTHFFCECCALCQEYRELQSRGWDPSIVTLAGKRKEKQEPAWASNYYDSPSESNHQYCLKRRK